MRSSDFQDEAFSEALTASMSALHGRFYRRAPAHARSLVLGPNLVASVMGANPAAVEEALETLARGKDVHGPRSVFQDAMEPQMVASVERITGRVVQRFVSNSRQTPLMEIERFYLRPSAAGRTSSLPAGDDAAADLLAGQRSRILLAANGLSRQSDRTPTAQEIAAFARVAPEDLYAHFSTLNACLEEATLLADDSS